MPDPAVVENTLSSCWMLGLISQPSALNCALGMLLLAAAAAAAAAAAKLPALGLENIEWSQLGVEN